jgi:hypothetical protein
MLYNLLKFVHVAGEIVWIGSVVTLTLLNVRLGRDGADGPGAVALARATGSFGRSVVGPAAGITLIAGIATSVVGRVDMGALWISWGFAAILISMALGMTVQRRTTAALETALAAPATSSGQVTALRSRLTTLNLVNLAVLLSATAVMVFKP